MRMKNKFSEEDVARACKSLKGIVHPTRAAIVDALRGGELSVNEIIEAIGDLPQANVSQHLGQMKGSGILASRRDGNRVIYALADKRIVKLVDLICELFCKR